MFDRPVSAVPAARSSNALLQLKLYAILGAAGLAALMGLVATVAWIGFTPDVPPVDAYLPRAEAAATVVARDFVANRPTAVPVASELDPTFGRQLSGLAADERAPLGADTVAHLTAERQTLAGEDGPVPYELHTFLVDAGDRLYRLDVTMLLTAEGPVLAAQPSLQPYLAPSGRYDPLDYRQLDLPSNAEALLTRPVTDQVAAWATAFAADDAAGLRTVTGDQASPGDYAGLGGFRVAATPKVLSVVPGSTEATLVLRVRLLLSSDSTQGFEVSADYDLLVADADGNLPKVVAWGPAGTPTLEPYMNNPTATAAE